LLTLRSPSASTFRPADQSPEQRILQTGVRWALLVSLTALAGCAGLQPGRDMASGGSGPPVDTPDSHWRADRPAIALTADQQLAFAAARARFEGTVDDADVTLGRLQTEEPDPRFADLWQRIRAGFAMPELNSPLVARMERFYTDRPEYLTRMMERGSRYLFHIVEEIDKRGMPMELALLPFVESAMNPTAMSPAQASGLWQFIPSTGRAYNLEQDWWVDNRRDVVKSTQAALDYLQKIYEMNDRDWFLALASYNWGEGAVGRAVKANRARGRPADYLSLNMPNETRQYVPRLLALKNIVLRADALGLRMPPLANRPYFVTVEKTRPIDLKLAAKFAGMSMEEFLELNPAHHRPVIAASRNNGIKIPADRLDGFLAAMAQHGEENNSFTTWQPYTLKSGETLEGLAARAGITPAELRRANGFKANSRILAGTRLLLPQRGSVDDRQVENFVAPRVIEQVDVPALYHTKRNAKETLAVIGKQYGVSAATLTQLNQLQGEPAIGRRLLIRPASTQTIMITEEGRRTVVAAPRPEPQPVRAVPVVARPPAEGSSAGSGGPGTPAKPVVAAPKAAPAKPTEPGRSQSKPAPSNSGAGKAASAPAKPAPAEKGTPKPVEQDAGRITRTGNTPPQDAPAGQVKRAAPKTGPGTADGTEPPASGAPVKPASPDRST
jgi:membrane-bound lytic murein transglycosylase D